jgi:starch synthase
MTSDLRVLHAAAECFPLAKTGGLGDVAAALPAALRALGCDARVAMPAYRGVAQSLGRVEPLSSHEINGIRYTVLRGALADGLPVYLFDAPPLFDRAGGPYADEAQQPYADNALRFGTFSAALAAFVAQGAAGFDPQVLHLHDWQTALAAPWLAAAPQRPALVFTIHNLAYQGQFGREAFETLGLPSSWWSPEALEFWGGFSCMKGGLNYADLITTVSPTYAREIQTPAFGCGLDGLLTARSDQLVGILNGIDTTVWNPATDPHLVRHYDSRTVTAGKQANRVAVANTLALASPAHGQTLPLVVFIGRLADQKGADLLLAAQDALMQMPLQLAVLASGDTKLEAAFSDWAGRAPAGRLAIRLAHDEALAHQLTAAADLLVMPSRFEPCGLNQMYAQRYGTIPVVHRTGGLADTVVDAGAGSSAEPGGSGVLFDHADVGGLLWGLRRGLELCSDRRRCQRLRRQGMARDFSWSASAQQYQESYTRLLRSRS